MLQAKYSTVVSVQGTHITQGSVKIDFAVNFAQTQTVIEKLPDASNITSVLDTAVKNNSLSSIDAIQSTFGAEGMHRFIT